MQKDLKKSNSSPSSEKRFSPYKRNSNKDGEKERCHFYEKQWEELMCPICMDHPHKAVSLICSSKGCRPYLCDTGKLLSNCFDKFCEVNSVTPSKSKSTTGAADDSHPNKFVGCGEEKGGEIVCPLCRGQISGWVIVEGAREFMDGIVRGCGVDSCDFAGNYVESKKHAKLQHPTAKPSSLTQVNNNSEHQRNEDAENEVDVGDEDNEELNGDDEDEEEEEEEANAVPLRPGDSFFNHIHFGPDEEILTQEYSVSNGILRYTRTTTTGKTYEYAALLGQN